MMSSDPFFPSHKAYMVVEEALDTPIINSFTVKWLILFILATPVQM